MCKFPCSSTTKLLLQAGADPQAVDRAKNTPLHIIVTYKKIVSDFLTLHAIIMALLDHGVHIDSVNAAGQTPLSAASTGVAEIILKSQADMSLKCLAAQSIRKYNLNYIGQVCISVFSSTIKIHIKKRQNTSNIFPNALFCLNTNFNKISGSDGTGSLHSHSRNLTGCQPGWAQ